MQISISALNNKRMPFIIFNRHYHQENNHRLNTKLNKIMLDLSKLQADVTAILGAEKSAVALLNSLGDAVKAIPPSTDPATQAALDALAGQIEAGTADLAAAVAANQPPAADATAAVPDGLDHKDVVTAQNPL
jgi:hypothetical protein